VVVGSVPSLMTSPHWRAVLSQGAPITLEELADRFADSDQDAPPLSKPEPPRTLDVSGVLIPRTVSTYHTDLYALAASEAASWTSSTGSSPSLVDFITDTPLAWALVAHAALRFPTSSASSVLRVVPPLGLPRRTLALFSAALATLPPGRAEDRPAGRTPGPAVSNQVRVHSKPVRTIPNPILCSTVHPKEPTVSPVSTPSEPVSTPPEPASALAADPLPVATEARQKHRPPLATLATAVGDPAPSLVADYVNLTADLLRAQGWGSYDLALGSVMYSLSLPEEGIALVARQLADRNSPISTALRLRSVLFVSCSRRWPGQGEPPLLAVSHQATADTRERFSNYVAECASRLPSSRLQTTLAVYWDVDVGTGPLHQTLALALANDLTFVVLRALELAAPPQAEAHLLSLPYLAYSAAATIQSGWRRYCLRLSHVERHEEPLPYAGDHPDALLPDPAHPHGFPSTFPTSLDVHSALVVFPYLDDVARQHLRSTCHAFHGQLVQTPLPTSIPGPSPSVPNHGEGYYPSTDDRVALDQSPINLMDPQF